MERLAFEDSIHKCAPGRLKSLQSFQVLLLRHALTRFPNVKRVVYSTCSVYPEENEMVVDEVLSNVGDAYHLIPVSTLLNAGWINFSSTDYNCKDNCLYAKPDVDHCNGFFVAIFERNFDVPLPEPRVRGKGKKNNGQNVGNDDQEQSKHVETKIDGNGECLEKSLNTEEPETPLKKKKRKKREKTSDETSGDAEIEKIISNDVETEENNEQEVLSEKKRKSNDEESENLPKKKRKKSKLKNGDDTEIILEKITIVDDENEETKLIPEELNVKSKKKKHKKSKKECDLEVVDEKLLTDSIVEENVESTVDSSTKKKHKKKKKQSSLDLE